MGERAFAGLARRVEEEVLDVAQELLLGHLADRLDDEAALPVGGEDAVLVLLLARPDDGNDRKPTTSDVRHQLAVRLVVELPPHGLGVGLAGGVGKLAPPGGQDGHRLVAGVESNFARVREKERRAASWREVHSLKVRIAMPYIW